LQKYSGETFKDTAALTDVQLGQMTEQARAETIQALQKELGYTFSDAELDKKIAEYNKGIGADEAQRQADVLKVDTSILGKIGTAAGTKNLWLMKMLNISQKLSFIL
jgi:hypothetical protein